MTQMNLSTKPKQTLRENRLVAPKEEGPEEGRGGKLGSAGVCSNTQDNDPEGPARGGPGWKAGVSRCVWLHTGR